MVETAEEGTDEKLIEDNSRRKGHKIGRLYLMSVDGSSLNVLDKHDMEGIFDARWRRQQTPDGKILLGIVTSIGQLLLYFLSEDSNHLLFLNSTDVSCGSALYLDWGLCSEGDEDSSIAVSDSEGNVSICRILNDQVLITHCFHAHQFEAWVTCFNNLQPAIVYSGGDDSAFRGFDLRADGTSSPIFTNRREHGAGVTSILHSSQKEELIYTGSYDEVLRVWDNRNLKTPVSEGVPLGGGVWRLRPHPENKPYILCSAMHDGFKVLETSKPDTPQILVHYTKHKSLAYGADWQRSSSQAQNVASVSFYDHLMTLWEVDL